jgi:C1A family cysteine protease
MKTFADMEKYRQAILRRGVLPETPLATDYGALPFDEEIPPRASWLNLRGPIRDQGLEGSCAGYGALKVYEMEHLRGTGEQIDSSERFCYNLAKIVDEIAMDYVEQEGTTLQAAVQVLRNYGVCQESDWPYVAGDKSHLDIARFLETLRKARKRRIAEYRNLLKDGVSESTLRVVKQALCRRPIVCGLMVDSNWLSVSPDGFIVPGEEMIGGHAIALAFYDDELEHNGRVGWFGFVNSWSENWGDGGIGYIGYGSFLQTLLSGYEIVLHQDTTRTMDLTRRRVWPING